MFFGYRNTSGDFLSMALRTSLITTTAPDKTSLPISICIIKFQVMNLLSITISPVGMVLNIIVLWFLGFQICRNAFSAYILNLAVADFLFLCSHSIFSFLIVCKLHYFLFYIRQLLDTVTMFAYVFGLSITTIISIECCLSIMWPIWYHCQRPRHTSAVICVLLWALSLVFMFLDGKAYFLLFSDPNSFWYQTFDIIITV